MLDWLECPCTGNRKTLIHEQFCRVYLESEHDRLDKKEAYKKQTRRARNAVISFLASSSFEYSFAEINEFVDEYFPGINRVDLCLGVWAKNGKLSREGLR